MFRTKLEGNLRMIEWLFFVRSNTNPGAGFLQGVRDQDGSLQVGAQDLRPLAHAEHWGLGLHVGLAHEETLGHLEQQEQKY